MKDAILYLMEANREAVQARSTGNTPFGAVLVDASGEIIMRQGNAEHDLHDATAHAELDRKSVV